MGSEDKVRGLDSIDAPLRPDEEELVKVGSLPEDERRRREAGLVAGESREPAADSEFFTAPVLDDKDEVTG